MRWLAAPINLLLCLSITACSTGGPRAAGLRAAGPSDGPRVGGQTGDPGVSDFTSFDPDPGRSMPGGGACPVEQVRVFGHDDGRYDARHALPNPPFAELGKDHLVTFDGSRGLAVVDVSGPAPVLRGRLPMTQSYGDLHVVGNRALLARRGPRPTAAHFEDGYPDTPEDAELLVVDLSDPAQPRVLQSVIPEQAPRASFLVVVAGRAQLIVLSDGGSAGCALPDPPFMLTRYELVGDVLQLRGQLDLGPDVSGVTQVGNDLLVLRSDGRLTFLALAELSSTSTESAALDATGWPTDVHADSPDSVRVISEFEEQEHVEVFDLRDRDAPVRRSDCSVPLPLRGDSPSFGATHTFFRGANFNGDSSAFSVSATADGTCQVRSASEGRTVALTNPAGLALELDQDGTDGIHMTLLNEADLVPIDQTTVHLPFELAPVAGLSGEVRALGQAGLLALPFSAQSGASGLQLVSLSVEGIKARGAVVPASPVLQTGLEASLTWGGEGLARLGVEDPDAPTVSAPLDVTPNFARVWAFGDHWVRVHAAPGYLRPEYFALQDYLSDNAVFAPGRPAHLEVVPAHEDPDLGAPIASLEVNPWARFARVGELLVSVLSRTDDRALRTQIDVFDLHDAAHPARVGNLQVPALWLPANTQRRRGSYYSNQRVAKYCLDCPGDDLDTRVLVVPGALILRSQTPEGAAALQVLDLSDPTAPALSEPLAVAPGGELLSAFARGTSIYCPHRVRTDAPDAGDGTARAHFYFTRIDLSDPAKPLIDPPVSVPGQLLAADGDQLFTREFAWSDGAYETLVHKLVLRDGSAAQVATHSFGARMAFALQLDGEGHLLADLEGLASSFFDNREGDLPETQLQVLDASTLELVGEARVGDFAQRLALQAGRAVYSADGGASLMDLRAAAKPRLAGHFPLLDVSPQRALLQGDTLLVEANGSLQRFTP